jgi:hypothetical protein
MSAEQTYVKQRLANSGINFSSVPKENVLATCQEYNGIISKNNYNAILCVIDDIYNELGCYEKAQNPK